MSFWNSEIDLFPLNSIKLLQIDQRHEPRLALVDKVIDDILPNNILRIRKEKIDEMKTSAVSIQTDLINNEPPIIVDLDSTNNSTIKTNKILFTMQYNIPNDIINSIQSFIDRNVDPIAIQADKDIEAYQLLKLREIGNFRRELMNKIYEE